MVKASKSHLVEVIVVGVVVVVAVLVELVEVEVDSEHFLRLLHRPETETQDES